MNELLQVLGSWNDGEGPAYARLADAIRRAIERGDLPPRAQLPPERSLATALNVSRNTATAAYDLLRTQDLLVSRQGSGTFVRAHAPRRWSRERRPARSARGTIEPTATGLRPGKPIEFLAAAFPGADLLTPELLAAADAETTAAADTHGYVTYGLLSLRAAVAAHLTRSGVATTAEQILVTSGAQAAIFLAALSIVGPGDPVLVEDPTWLGAIGAYRAAGAEVIGVPGSPEGINLNACRDLIARHAPALIHVSPSFNNPTGLVTSERTRVALARMAKGADVPIVEDNTLADLDLGGRRLPPIAGGADGALVLTIGSTSKLFWGGLRVGWIRGPEDVIDGLGQLKLVVDYGTALPSQTLAVAMFQRLEEIRAARRRQAAERLGVLQDELRRRLPAWRWRAPDGGLSLWVQLPTGLSIEFCQVAERHGVVLTPGSMASPAGGSLDRIRLPFVHEPDVLVEGVRRLEAAWKAYDRGLDQGRVRQVIV